MAFVLFTLSAIALGFVGWRIQTEQRKNGERMDQIIYIGHRLLGVPPMPAIEPEGLPGAAQVQRAASLVPPVQEERTWSTLGPNPQSIPNVPPAPTMEQQAAFFARRG